MYGACTYDMVPDRGSQASDQVFGICPWAAPYYFRTGKVVVHLHEPVEIYHSLVLSHNIVITI